ncbi:hypothetical protein SAMN04488564_101868 [Lentzea waywayandensis]|uniref:Antimicrobial peptide system protein, SdpA family n=1 Tax=Lentzea waywayandensis TaxID=84724 RepID=A0A1I6D2C3_9PSEU|nr:hypothetical protein [Lentzea waywayandensis]SFQ99492.1 hypothetical protein SAMN04488564_101868 [Lentzea waywayandensis]
MSAEMDSQARAAKGMAFTGAALGVILLATTVAQLPADVVGQRIGAQREMFRLFWPQGMKLFTNAAGREFTVAYHHDEAAGTFVPITRTAGDRDYLGGLDRGSYADLSRLLATVDELPGEHWRDCAAATVSDCAAVVTQAPRVVLNSYFSAETPCGPTVFAIERPSRDTSSRHVVRVAAVDLTCAPR